MSNQCPGCNAVGCRKPEPVEQPIEGAEVRRSDLGSCCHEPPAIVEEPVLSRSVVKRLAVQRGEA